MSKGLGFRLSWALLLLLCVGVMGLAFYLEYFQGLIPCPLCSLQRIVIGALALIFLIALVHNPLGWGRRVYASLSFLLCILGMILAGRQFWLQHQPPSVDGAESCLPGLTYLFQHMPVGQALMTAFQGSSSCAEQGNLILGMSVATWSLILFGAIAFISLILMWIRTPRVDSPEVPG